MDTDRVVALLEAWAEWRGSVRRVLLAHMQPRCTLGRMVRLARQGGELWEHNEATEPDLPDDLMARVDRLVCALPARQLAAIRITYIEGRHWRPRKRARRLRVSKATYYRDLKAAHEAIDAGIEWRDVLIA